MISWIEQWFFENCDGYWEHENSISIQTSDNPGWIVEIDLSNTQLQDLSIPYSVIEISDRDWIGYSVVNKKFTGVGDIFKLEKIIELFKTLVDKYTGFQ
ncbi:immunity 53 family protein [Polluticaenibacter yanchengensis]|uniref:Immunity 53 family protein n=1 Tax=Polluticaenibacter yanchengensis TaxID=3014562 RepID=A0ABT4UKT3_9BACT|nr:immunity 53 family protein [Chitinophagaceae bacterium LY-5]